MSAVKVEDLLKSGCHFGHLTSRWNPKMKPYIFMEKNGIHVIDLNKTSAKLEAACEEIRKIASHGENMLYVGTKKQAQDIIKSEAERSNNFYVVERWLGGQLTNFATVKRSVRKWKSLEKKKSDGTYEKITKKEILDIERSKEKLAKVLGGIAEMKRIPGAIFIVDTLKEHIAIKEAIKLGIPIFAIVDTNSNPGEVDFPIPANDDASKSIKIITKAVTDAFIEGAQKAKAKKIDKENEEAKKLVKKEKKFKATELPEVDVEEVEKEVEAAKKAKEDKAVEAPEAAEEKKAPAKKAPAKKTAAKKPAAKKADAEEAVEEKAEEKKAPAKKPAAKKNDDRQRKLQQLKKTTAKENNELKKLMMLKTKK